MNLVTKQNQTRRLKRTDFWLQGVKDGGKGEEGGLGWPQSTGTLLSAVWQPGREGSLGENGYICLRG